jgi:hypothetical protein
MASRKKLATRKLAAHSDSDAIRIVPLHHPQSLQAAAPRLTYRNGPLMEAVEVFTIFWGAAWNTAPLNKLMQDMNGFFDYILSSSLMDQLAEYNAGKYKISHGKRTGSVVIARHRCGHPKGTEKRHRLKQGVSQTWRQYFVLRIHAGRSQGSAGGLGFLPGVLRISQRHWRKGFLCGDALSRLRWLHWRPGDL